MFFTQNSLKSGIYIFEIRTRLNGEQAVRERNRVQFRMDVQSTLNGYLVAFEV